MMTKKHWLKKLRIAFRITSQIRQIRENVAVLTRAAPRRQYSAEQYQNFNAQVIQLIDLCQGFLFPDREVLELADYEAFSPEEVNLSLSEILVLFRRTLKEFQAVSPNVQQNAVEILYSYFIELQGLYDLIFVRRFETSLSHLPPTLAATEESPQRSFRCFRLTEHALARLKTQGLPDDVGRKLELLQSQALSTEEKFSRDLETALGKDVTKTYKTAIFEQAQVMSELAADPVIQEYQSIPYQHLMNTSLFHHFRVIVRMLGAFVITAVKEHSQGMPCCRRILDPAQIDTLETLRACVAKHPLTETAKLRVALQRHFLRLGDIFTTRVALRLGRPIFELLILATWFQTVKDHIIPGQHEPRWQAASLDLQQDEVQEVADDHGSSGTIRISSAFFMQTRVKFHLERFLIFKNRTMTVGDIVRPTEFGNWMRQNSPDEFLQFFNVALGDMQGLGIRTMPEHEITESQDTLWLYYALMQFVPGGIISYGSIKMRETNYGLTKAKQLLYDLLYFDPRFQRSSSVWNDLKTMIDNLRVLKKGRVGKALQDTESFEGQKREL